MSIKGIDISNHNGTVNFAKVKSDNVEVVYIKATEGTTYQDELLDQHYQGAIAEGLKVGFYHFLVGTSEPETQAENFFNQIKDKQNDLKPCLDIEKNGFDVMDFALRFITKFRQLTDMSIVIYTGPCFANDNLDSRLASYPCWIANYCVESPMATDIWGTNYVGHQYNEYAIVYGVNTDCDLNKFTEDILLTEMLNTSEVDTNETENIIGYGLVTASVLNVRDSPDGEIIGQLKNGEQVKIEKTVEGWYSIYYGDHGGYVSKEFISTINDYNGITGTVTASILNVRDSINGNIIGQLNKSDKVKIYKKESGWYSIYYGDHGGYVSSYYIEI